VAVVFFVFPRDTPYNGGEGADILNERIAAKLDDDIAEMSLACLNSNKLLFDEFAMDAMHESLDEPRESEQSVNMSHVESAPTQQQAAVKRQR